MSNLNTETKAEPKTEKPKSGSPGPKLLEDVINKPIKDAAKAKAAKKLSPTQPAEGYWAGIRAAKTATEKPEAKKPTTPKAAAKKAPKVPEPVTGKPTETKATNPTPTAPTASKIVAPAQSKTYKRPSDNILGKVKLLVDSNPHKPTSKDFTKFKKLRAGMSVKDVLAAGVDKGYINYAAKRKLLEVR